MTVRVLIADDDPSIRGALGDLLRSEPGYLVVGCAADPESAIDLAGLHHPDVAILDVKMPGGGGVRAAEGIRSASPGTCVLALSAWDDQATVRRMHQAGASGYVVKGSAPDDILEMIRRATRGAPLSAIGRPRQLSRPPGRSPGRARSIAGDARGAPG